MKRFLSMLLSLAISGALGVNAFAASGPEIEKSGTASGSAVAYDYLLLDPENTYLYRNEAYFYTTNLLLTADNGKVYRLLNPKQLADGSSFTAAPKVSINAQATRSIQQERGENAYQGLPSFCVKLEDSAVLSPISLGLEVRYRALRDVPLSVREAGSDGRETLTVKKNAVLTVSQRLRIDYDKLIRLDYNPKNPDAHLELGALIPSGVDGDFMTPMTDRDADYSWESIDRIAAEVNGDLDYAPKLAARWDNPRLLKKFASQDAFIRSFTGTNASQGERVTLLLTNPFLTIEGEETIPHKEVVIYEYENGALKNITGRFRYTVNSDGEGAFALSTDHLGTYILTDKEL